MTETKVWILYDGRYLTDPESAIVYEFCNSKREAKENSRDYGTDTVIVEAEIVGRVIKNEKIIGTSAE